MNDSLPTQGQEERGESRLSIFVNEITEAELEELANDLAGWFVERGYNTDSANTRVLIAVRGEAWGSPDELIQRIDREGNSLVVIPQPEDAGQ